MNEHEGSNPKVPVNQEVVVRGTTNETLNHTRHQIPDDYEIADANTKAFYSDCSVEYHSGIGVGELREGKERSRSLIEVLRTSQLQIKTEPRGNSRP